MSRRHRLERNLRPIRAKIADECQSVMTPSLPRDVGQTILVREFTEVDPDQDLISVFSDYTITAIEDHAGEPCYCLEKV